MEIGSWYVIDGYAGGQEQRYVFGEDELRMALPTYGQVRRDLPGGYRIELRWVERGVGSHHEPFDGQIWKGMQPLAQVGGPWLSLLLDQLRAESASLDPPLDW